MRIPLNWLAEFVKLPSSQKNLTDRLTMAGHMLDKIDKVNGSVVVDLELRGNRADCYSIIGIAREVSALFSSPSKYPKPTFKYKKVPSLKDLTLTANNQFVRRVMMSKITNVKIEDSPKWLKDRLNEYGVTPINNVVDLTNYVMIETGQPMHAFDADLIGKKIEIRLAKRGEKMTTFQDKVLILTTEDLVWANNESVLSVAGAIGGKTHSISPSTKNVLLEAASYDRANIRRSIHRHNLFTDAGVRHEKELDPNLVEVGILRFLELIEKNKWGKVSVEVSDFYPKPVRSWNLILDFKYLEVLSGLTIEKSKITKILESLNFDIIEKTANGLKVLVPTYRTDVTLEEDLVEEVLRIYGYENIPTQTLSLEIPKVVTPSYIDQELNIKNVLVSLGFDEIISSSFVKENNLSNNKALEEESYLPVRVSNKPSPDVEELRMSLFPNIFEFTRKIINERGTEAYLFELGKVYLKSKSSYIEKRKLGIAYCQKKDGEFVYFKGILEAIFSKLDIENVKFDNLNIDLNFLNDSYKISIGKEAIGFGARSNDVYYCEIDLDLILNKQKAVTATLWPKYPPQIEDLTLAIPPKTRIGEVLDLLSSSSQVANAELKDTFKDSYTFRVWYQDKSKTLNDTEVEEIRNQILNGLKNKFGATLKS